MGARHAHGSEIAAPRQTVRAIVGLIILLAMTTLIAIIWLWPSEKRTATQEPGKRESGVIVDVRHKPCDQASEQADVCGEARVEITSGPHVGHNVASELPSGPGSQDFAVGDEVVLYYTPDQAEGVSQYQIFDHERSSSLWLLAVAFAFAVIAFGRWRGVMALIGLAVTFLLLLTFIIPAIRAGESPLLVAIVGASAIMLAVLYLTHGFTVSTSIAIVGTVLSLSLTGLFAVVSVDLAHLTGISDENALNLGLSYGISGQGLLLAGIIIGALGVLDDVTVTQAATVSELAQANPEYTFGQLYRAAARVGRAHIASVVNTIVLAYAGAALPLLLLISEANQPLGQVLTFPNIAEEIVRSVAGTLGIVAAVPITTGLAVFTCTRMPARGRRRSPDGTAGASTR